MMRMTRKATSLRFRPRRIVTTPPKKERKKRKTVVKSTTDPDCGLFVKHDNKKQLAYTRYTGLTQVMNWVKLKFAAINPKKYEK